MSDPTLLALVVDDPLAPSVLAAWRALKLSTSEVASDATRSRIASLVRADMDATARTLDRCLLAELLVDGGISPLAVQWLSAFVGSRLGPRKGPKK